MTSHLTVGLAAHVDAGKTTLSESLLFTAGVLRHQGRVDHGDAFLDTEKMEKERGITIFSKGARLTWKKVSVTLLDTPGHTDFAGETERALQVMDAAVLIISGPDGIQSHTRTLWRLLEKHGIPVFLFVNKMDRTEKSREALVRACAELSDRIVDFTDDPAERIAMCDETCLDLFLREGSIPEERILQMISRRQLFPCYFGSALRNEGVEKLLDGLAGLAGILSRPKEFGARVFKIGRDPQGGRMTFLKVTGGVLKIRDLLSGNAGGREWQQKISEIRLYSGERYTAVPQAEAGEVCCVTGLTEVRAGDSLGFEQHAEAQTMRPCYACRVVPEKGADIHRVYECLKELEEEEPLLQTEYEEQRQEVRIHSMGDVHLEVLHQLMQERFGIEISFTDSSVLYRETIAGPAEGAGHYEPLRHYAEVHLRLEPLPAGSGLQYASEVSTDDLASNWQRLILTHLQEKTHRGVLTGSPVTDLKITLTAGRAHLKHTEGGDFRQATYRAVRQGLMKAESVLLEPYVKLDILLPADCLGRVMNDLALMGGKPEIEDAAEAEERRRISAVVPAAACRHYGMELRALTRGAGEMTVSYYADLPCQHAEQVIAERGYDPLRDVFNSPDSVFCSHGAGVTVPWDQADDYMHLSVEEKRKDSREEGSTTRLPAQPLSADEEETLRYIFEKTYGPIRSRQLIPPARQEKAPAAPPEVREAPAPEKEILLVDGYNVLFAWKEWKPLLKDQFDAARSQLTDLMCDYAGMTGKEVLLIFDAYKVKGNPGSVEKHRNIYVVYTRETQTADAYIEKVTLLTRQRARVRVVTSDRPEQLIALGHEAMRTSAREFHREVDQVQGSIAEYLARNYRPGSERVFEKMIKDAWKQKQKQEKE